MDISGPGDHRLGLGKHRQSRGGVRGGPVEGRTGRVPGAPHGAGTVPGRVSRA